MSAFVKTVETRENGLFISYSKKKGVRVNLNGLRNGYQ